MVDQLNFFPSAIRFLVPKGSMKTIGINTNIGFSSFVTRVTGFDEAIELIVPAIIDHGTIKRIVNDSAADLMTLNSPINVVGAATNTISIDKNGGFILLLYLDSPVIEPRFQMIDGEKVTLS